MQKKRIPVKASNRAFMAGFYRANARLLFTHLRASVDLRFLKTIIICTRLFLISAHCQKSVRVEEQELVDFFIQREVLTACTYVSGGSLLAIL